MKKIAGLLSVMCVSVIVHAQINKGAVLLGGHLSYNNTTTESSPTQNAQTNRGGSYNFSAGKAVKENAVFGFFGTYNPNRLKNASATNNGVLITDSKERQYNAGVFYRKYKQLIKGLYIFGEGGAGYTGRHRTDITRSNSIGSTYKESGGQIYFQPGISYNIFKKLQAELLIPNLISSQYTHSNSGQKQFSFGTSLNGFSVNYLAIGFHFIL